MTRHPRAVRRQPGGFTLLELLVVLGIFAVMATMAYGGLDTVLNARQSIDTALRRTAQLQKAYWIMRDDFQNGSDRTVIGDSDNRLPALRTQETDRQVGFTRFGWPNPLDLPRSTLRRVGYLYRGDRDQLLRRIWPVLDRAPSTQPVDTVLLGGITRMRWRFLDDHGQWHRQWPASGGATSGGDVAGPPRAVELTLETDSWGRLRWLFSYGEPAITAPSSPPAVSASAPVPQTAVAP